MMFDFGIVKWLSSLDTDAKKLFAVLLTVIFILLSFSGWLLVRQETVEEERDKYWMEIVAKKDLAHAALLAEEVKKKEEAQQAQKDEMNRSFELMSSLWKEQKEVNQRNVKVDKTQLNLAQKNKKTIVRVNQETKELVKIIDQKK